MTVIDQELFEVIDFKALEAKYRYIYISRTAMNPCFAPALTSHFVDASSCLVWGRSKFRLSIAPGTRRGTNTSFVCCHYRSKLILDSLAPNNSEKLGQNRFWYFRFLQTE